MRLFYILALLGIISTSCHTQSNEKGKLIGGPCEGCEAILEYTDRELKTIDTLPGYLSGHPKIQISGIVYQLDGVTPASDIILYIYHTNREGLYVSKGNEQGWGKRHGSFRGWAITNTDGAYTFYTTRPASYPNSIEPEHIHITVKEPNKNEYYLDEYIFEDDPLLTLDLIKELENRGGSGILKLQPNESGYFGSRDITLGLNIPNYK